MGAALIVAMVDGPVAVALTASGDNVSRQSALILAPFTLCMAAFSFGGSLIASRFGVVRTAAIGIALVVAGYVLLWFMASSDNVYTMVPGLIIAGVGFGLGDGPARGDRARRRACERTGIRLGAGDGGAVAWHDDRHFRAHRHRRSPAANPDRATRTGRPAIGESTAQFLLRQSQYIQDTAIPLSFRVITETFFLAAMLAAVAFIPLAFLWKRLERA